MNSIPRKPYAEVFGECEMGEQSFGLFASHPAGIRSVYAYRLKTVHRRMDLRAFGELGSVLCGYSVPTED